MLLNSIIAGIVGCLLLALYAMKGLFDIIKNMDQRINKLTRVTDFLHDRLSRLEIISVVDQEEAKKNMTNDE